MGINATYKKQDSYLKIEKFWGSVKEGFTAWVAVYDQKGGKELDKFAIRAPYNEKPFESIYAALKQYPNISNVKEEDGTIVSREEVVAEVQVEAESTPVTQEAPKKTRSKKK